MSALSLPPLFTPLATVGTDPLGVAIREARDGCDPGLVTYDIRQERLRAAIVFAPEVPLNEAAVMLPICGVGFQNALGALAPPEVSVHLEWGGAIRINGAICGRLTLSAQPAAPQSEPDWLVVGLNLSLWEATEDTGLAPDTTTLYGEGCAEVDPALLLEAWVRHTLVWLNRWLDEGLRPVFSEWKGIAHGLNEETRIGQQQGTFLGVDETFGMLLKSGDQTVIIPLTEVLTEPA